MDPLLQEITMLPGVFGCYVFNAEQQIICSKMPPLFKENNLKIIGNLLVRTIQIGSMAMLNFKGIEMQYNGSLLMIKPLPKEAVLILICEPNANKSLISMTTGILAEDIAKTLANSKKIQKAVTQATQQEQSPLQKQVQQTQVNQVKDAEIDARLAPILEQVKDALAMAIGPIAGPIMKDSIEIWATQNSPSFSNLSTLTELLCKEIDDDTLEKEFMAKVKTIKG